MFRTLVLAGIFFITTAGVAIAGDVLPDYDRGYTPKIGFCDNGATKIRIFDIDGWSVLEALTHSGDILIILEVRGVSSESESTTTTDHSYYLKRSGAENAAVVSYDTFWHRLRYAAPNFYRYMRYDPNTDCK